MLSRLCPLLFHADFKSSLIETVAIFFNNISSQIDRKSISIIELENCSTGDDGFFGCLQPGNLFLENPQAVPQSLNETFFLILDNLGNKIDPFCLFGISFCHGLKDKYSSFEQNRIFKAEHFGMAHCPAHNPTQYIPPPFIGRENTVGNQKSRSTTMISHHPHRNIIFLIVAIGFPGELFNVGNNDAEQIGVVI